MALGIIDHDENLSFYGITPATSRRGFGKSFICIGKSRITAGKVIKMEYLLVGLGEIRKFLLFELGLKVFEGFLVEGKLWKI